MVEFEVRGDLAVVQKSVIDCNFEEVKAWLQENLAAYRSLVVTPETVPEAKTDRAAIRKIRERLDEQRKAVKKAYTAPLTTFEGKCRTLALICDEAADALDTQIKAYEEKERRERLEAVRSAFDAAAKDLVEDQILTWEDVEDKRWGNATYGGQKAIREMEEKVRACREDVETIRGMESDFTPALLQHYAACHDLGATLREAKRLQARQELEWRYREEQEAPARPRAARAADPPRRDAPETVPVATQEAAPEAGDELLVMDFRVWGTWPQIQALGAWMRQNGVRYGRIPGTAGKEKEEED